MIRSIMVRCAHYGVWTVVHITDMDFSEIGGVNGYIMR